jgi:hypothetical protein
VVALRISAFSTKEGRDDMIYADQRGQEETKRRVGEAGQQQSSNKPKGALEKQQRKSRTLERRDFGDPKHPEKQEIDGLGVRRAEHRRTVRGQGHPAMLRRWLWVARQLPEEFGRSDPMLTGGCGSRLG